MSVTLRSFVLGFVLLAGAAILYHLSAPNRQNASQAILEQYPNFSIHNSSGNIYDADGRLTYSFAAQDVLYYRRQNLVELTEAEAFFFDDKTTDAGETEGWKIRADTGSVYINDYALLKGNITITPTFAGSEVTAVTTDEVTYNMRDRQIYTDSPVSMYGARFENHGTGFRGDLETKIFSLAGEPHAIYYPSTAD